MRLHADFNGIFGDLLCLSHSDTCRSETGAEVQLHHGMVATAFEDDVDDAGRPDKLIATGVVERAPDWLECNGSRWVLRIDNRGVHRESDLRASS